MTAVAPPVRDVARMVRSLDSPESQVLKSEARTRVWRTLEAGEMARVIKLYRQRGALTCLRSRLSRFRTEREFRRLQHLTRWDIPCTPPVSWGWNRSAEHGHHEILVMEEIPNAVRLLEYLGRGIAATELVPLFQIVRRMHESGFCHQALYATNVLVNPRAPVEDRYFIADVPRSWTFPRSLVGSGAALHDLLDLVLEIEEAVGPRVEPRIESVALKHYGINQTTRARWTELRERQGDPRSKRTRAIRDLRIRVHWAFSWASMWRQRHHPPEAP